MLLLLGRHVAFSAKLLLSDSKNLIFLRRPILRWTFFLINSGDSCHRKPEPITTTGTFFLPKGYDFIACNDFTPPTADSSVT